MWWHLPIPKIAAVRNVVLKSMGHRPHPGSRLTHGKPFIPETRLEKAIGSVAGGAWNILAI